MEGKYFLEPNPTVWNCRNLESREMLWPRSAEHSTLRGLPTTALDGLPSHSIAVTSTCFRNMFMGISEVTWCIYFII